MFQNKNQREGKGASFDASLLPWSQVSGTENSPLWHSKSPHLPRAKSLRSCPSLCHPMDGSPQGSSVHGILQARILEWVAISFSRGSS